MKRRLPAQRTVLACALLLLGVVAWATIAGLATTAGSSALVWGRSLLMVGLLFAAGALLLAWGAIRALGPGETADDGTGGEGV